MPEAETTVCTGMLRLCMARHSLPILSASPDLHQHQFWWAEKHQRPVLWKLLLTKHQGVVITHNNYHATPQ